ncbi:MAG: methionyl-tRNA formyltransferase, partial [Saprospiraceae bacterium]|nr:methionyl-tRNA formyltransferase [Saprospiraceae bacterium]
SMVFLVLQPERLEVERFLTATALICKLIYKLLLPFRMLPEIVWAMPKLGTFNLHGSLLPKYRGAAPINWAIIKGEIETGVTTFFLQQEIDTGDILFQEKMLIEENDTAGDVHDRMMLLGAKVVLKTVQSVETQTIKPIPQNDNFAVLAPKIFHETCEINFEDSTQKVYNFIRGLSPYPAAWTTLDGLELKIIQTTKLLEPHNLIAGSVVTNDKHFIRIATNDGFIEVHELQLQGRKRMKTKEFLNGYKIPPETQLKQHGRK